MAKIADTSHLEGGRREAIVVVRIHQTTNRSRVFPDLEALAGVSDSVGLLPKSERKRRIDSVGGGWRELLPPRISAVRSWNSAGSTNTFRGGGVASNYKAAEKVRPHALSCRVFPDWFCSLGNFCRW